jgi:uncharacterized membrane protein YccF (DUF307 family)
VLAGWWLSLGHLIAGVVPCITIIGIPLGLGSFKMIPVCLWPLGREIVPVEQADATAITIGAGSAAQPASPREA